MVCHLRVPIVKEVEHDFDTRNYDISHMHNVLDIHFRIRGGGNDKKVISGSNGIRAVA